MPETSAANIGSDGSIGKIRTPQPSLLRRATAFAAAPAAGMMVAALCFEILLLLFDSRLRLSTSLPQVITDLVGLYVAILYGVVTVGAMPAYIVTVVLGVPLHAAFEAKNWRNLYGYLALGAGLSLMAFLLGHLLSSLAELAVVAIPATVIGGLAGGLAFRRICFRNWVTRQTPPGH